MDTLTFISNLVKFLVWPVVVFVLALVFRRRLEGLLDRLVELKFHKVSVKLEGAPEALKTARRKLQLPEVQLYQATERILISPVASGKEVTVVHDRQEPFLLDATEAPKRVSLDVAPISDPSVEFELAWRELQADLLEKARQFGASRLRKADSAAIYLEEKDAVPHAFLAAFAQVRAVYEAAKRHPDSPIDAKLASEFKRTCEKLRQYLTQVDA